MPRDEVVGLEKNFSQAALARRVVLEVEAVETVEGVVGVHVQRVDAQVVGIKPQRLEHLRGMCMGGVGQSDAKDDENLTSATSLGTVGDNNRTHVLLQ